MITNNLKNFSLRLSLWQQLQMDQAPRAQRAQALCDALAYHPMVKNALVLTWRPSTRAYHSDVAYPSLPPSNCAQPNTDAPLREHLQHQGNYCLSATPTLPSRLLNRLQRIGWHTGLLVPFALCAEHDSIVVIQTTHTQGTLETLRFLLQTLQHNTALASSSKPYAMHSAEPLPSAICAAGTGTILQANNAFLAFCQRKNITAEQCFPSNHLALVKSCSQQQRAIEEVEATAGNRLFLWSYVPINPQQVLLRGTDATEKLQKEKAAIRARRLYRLITENTTDLISRHTLDGTFLDATPASWALLGYWPEELRNRPARDLFHPKDLAHLQHGAALALQELGYHTMTYRLQHKLGHYLWFETASRAIRETYTGAVVEVISVSRDITERVQAEENRRRLAEVVEVNTDIILFVNLQGAVTYANKAARQALVLQPEELSSLADILDQNTFAAIQENGWQQAVRRGSWSRDAHINPLREKKQIPVSLVLLAHRSAGGERYFSLILRDMTERALREAEQRQYQEDKAHSARLIALGEVASAIAHEMNQPLAAIANFAAACQRHVKQGDHAALSKVAQGLGHIGHQAHHASEVIRRLRAFLRKGQRHLEPLQLGEVLSDTITLCQWELERNHVNIRYVGEHRQPPVYADRTLLEQVLLNLIRNALEANMEVHQQRSSTITLHLQHNQHTASVEVHDQGPGSDEETLANMFNPFFTSKEDGLGLGLSMSRTIIEGFGGDLTAQTAPGGGLILRCTLPLAHIKQEIA